MLSYLLCSADLEPFPKLKLMLSGCFFDDILTIKAVERWALEVIGGEYFEQKDRKINRYRILIMFSRAGRGYFMTHCVGTNCLI